MSGYESLPQEEDLGRGGSGQSRPDPEKTVPVIEGGAVEVVVGAREAAGDLEASPPSAAATAGSSVAARVRVVAPPCGLPPGYVLPVRTSDGRAFDVTVPDGGAGPGQVFEAARLEREPVTGRFSSDLFECGSEGPWLWIATFCHGVAFAALMEKLKLDPCGGRNCPRLGTFWVFSVLWVTFKACLFLVHVFSESDPATYLDQTESGVHRLLISFLFVASALLVVAVARARAALRWRYRIPGSCLADVISVFFCACCSALQMYRHMDASGDRPMRFESKIDAETV
jgi:Cys-rich protein (TIGR01571 family)